MLNRDEKLTHNSYSPILKSGIVIFENIKKSYNKTLLNMHKSIRKFTTFSFELSFYSFLENKIYLSLRFKIVHFIVLGQ